MAEGLGVNRPPYLPSVQWVDNDTNLQIPVKMGFNNHHGKGLAHRKCSKVYLFYYAGYRYQVILNVDGLINQGST